VVTGYLPPADVPVALETMDVVVVPYATEDSVSYSLHVALAQGRPVVATALAPLCELQQRGDCLALVQPDDARDLAKTLGTLLDDPGARGRLAQAARAYARASSADVATPRWLPRHSGWARCTPTRGSCTSTPSRIRRLPCCRSCRSARSPGVPRSPRGSP